MEKKRHHRTLPAVINGLSITQAVRSGLVNHNVPESMMAVNDIDEVASEGVRNDDDNDDSMFFPGHDEENPLLQSTPSVNPFSTNLNPQATVFQPQSIPDDLPEPTPEPKKPSWMTNFGQSREPAASSVFNPATHEQPSLGGAKPSLPATAGFTFSPVTSASAITPPTFPTPTPIPAVTPSVQKPLFPSPSTVFASPTPVTQNPPGSTVFAPSTSQTKSASKA